MFIGIGEKIKGLRLEKGITEDVLAKYLGVDCKEVIKWEKGELYPDIELLPVIADYFEVPTDFILCMEQFDHEERIRGFLERFQSLVSEGDLRGATETMREGLVHFPGNFTFKCMLMYSLYLSCDRPAAIKHYSGEIKQIYDDIQQNCTDDAIRLEAKRLLCLHYYEDLENPDKAREIAMSLPGRKISREDMLPKISEGDDKLRAIRENIAAYTDLLTAAVADYSECDKTLNIKEKIAFYNLAKQLRKQIYTDGDYLGGCIELMKLNKQLAVYYIGIGENSLALDCLEECAARAAEFDAIKQKVSLHTSPLVRGVRFVKSPSEEPAFEAKGSMRSVFLSEIATLPVFEPIKYDARMVGICDVCLAKDEPEENTDGE